MRYDKSRISNALRAVKSKNTTPERLLRQALRKKGITGYRIHWSKVAGKPDIAFPSKRIAVFVHGCFWHRCPHCKQKDPQSNVEFWNAKLKSTQERDLSVENDLIEHKWQVIVIWECQIKNGIEHCVDIIQKAYLDVSK